MYKKFVVGLGKKRPIKLGNNELTGLIIKTMSLDKTNFSGEECIEYFNLRSDALRNKLDKYFPELYTFKDHGNSHKFDLFGGGTYDTQYSVDYKIDNNDVFTVTERIPSFKLIKDIAYSGGGRKE